MLGSRNVKGGVARSTVEVLHSVVARHRCFREHKRVLDQFLGSKSQRQDGMRDNPRRF
jgi:hypothetical protein